MRANVGILQLFTLKLTQEVDNLPPYNDLNLAQ